MPENISSEEVLQSLKGLTIPPRPHLLTAIAGELDKADPDFDLLAKRIATDVGIAAAMLKIINSPFFGLQTKIGSISIAIQMLGMQNVKSIVTGLLLKQTIGQGAPSLERFWDSAEKVARISAYIASTLPRGPRDEAYTLGLFHECGIPLLMQRFPNYKDVLKAASNDTRPMVLVEDELLGTNHAVVGFMVAKNWGLPEHLSTAILRHHDTDLFSFTDKAPAGVCTLVAINFLAEFINDKMLRMRDNLEWNTVSDAVLEHLGIDSGDFEELKDDVIAVIH
jgi:HD-like signal output (HDOD) protein